MVKAITDDKKTTILGVLAIVIAVAQVAVAILDGDPQTVPDFDSIFNLFGFGAVGAGLLMAGDGGKK